MRITRFLEWLEHSQREKHRTVGKVLGWPFFTLGCELGICEPLIASILCEVESAELRYFELAIRDAIAREVIEPCVARAEALALRSAIEGILARARILGELDELSPLTSLPNTVLRLKPAAKTMALPPGEGVPDSNLNYEHHQTENEADREGDSPRTLQLRASPDVGRRQRLLRAASDLRSRAPRHRSHDARQV
jgi:hypothetical protein